MKRVIIADDLTGACDCAIAMKTEHTSAQVFWDTGQGEIPLTADIVSISTNSRALHAEEAEAAVRDAIHGVNQSASCLWYKKVDSVFRGNVGLELETMMKMLNKELLLLAPATPVQGRVVKDGKLFIRGKPKPLADIAALLKWEQGTYRLMHEEDYRDGGDGLRKKIQESWLLGIKRFLFDSTSQKELEFLGSCLRGLRREALLAGTSGFASSLGEEIQAVAADRGFPEAEEQNSGPLLMILGSCQEMTYFQCRELLEKKQAAFVWLDTERCMSGKILQEIERVLEECGRLLKQDISCLVFAVDTLASEEGVFSTEPGACPEEISYPLITEVLGNVAKELLNSRPFRAVLISGGDTARQVLDKLGVESMKLLKEVLPGIPLAVIEREGRRNLIMTKSGGFGTEKTLSDICRLWEKQEKTKDYSDRRRIV